MTAEPLPHLFAHYETVVRDSVQAIIDSGNLPEGIDLSTLSVEPPRDPTHGDLATSAAMALARPARMKPRDIAELIADRLRRADGLSDVSIAGPGFINMTLDTAIWYRVVAAVNRLHEGYGASDLGAGSRVNVEYVSANPTGPLHVGHCRGAVFGDALANLLALAGHDVTREYYINDAGVQVDVLARSAYLRYREALGEEIGEIPSGLYPGAYLVPIGEKLAEAHGRALLDMPESEWLGIVREAAIEAMMDYIRSDLERLSIRHDVFFSERSLSGANDGGDDLIAAAMAALRERDLVYDGRLPPPKGQPPEDWEDREQTLFRSTSFGDDIDRPLIKSNGDYTYFASDIAYHYDKFVRGFTRMIDVLGADHGGYEKRMKAAVEAITGGEGALEVKLCQLVRLFKDGEPVKMSKRSGEFVTLADVVDEVGPDPVRFMMLYRKNEAPLDFDFARVTEQSRDNPVFYVQYAHARIASVMRNAAEQCPDLDIGPEALATADLGGLDDRAEIAVMKHIALYPRIIEAAARQHEPHRIAFALYELAGAVHALWTRGKELPHLRFIQPDQPDTTKARLALLCAVAYVLRSGLGVLGVSAPEEMH